MTPTLCFVLTRACMCSGAFGCSRHVVLVWEEEWTILKDLYQPDHVITASFSDGCLMTDPSEC